MVTFTLRVWSVNIKLNNAGVCWSSSVHLSHSGQSCAMCTTRPVYHDSAGLSCVCFHVCVVHQCMLGGLKLTCVRDSQLIQQQVTTRFSFNAIMWRCIHSSSVTSTQGQCGSLEREFISAYRWKKLENPDEADTGRTCEAPHTHTHGSLYTKLVLQWKTLKPSLVKAYYLHKCKHTHTHTPNSHVTQNTWVIKAHMWLLIALWVNVPVWVGLTVTCV